MFRVIVRIRIVNNEQHYDGRILALRGHHAVIVGFVQLHPAEWDEFMGICANENIEITYEPTRTAVPA